MSFQYLAKIPAFAVIYVAAEWAFHPPVNAPPKEANRERFGRPDYIAKLTSWFPTLGAVVCYTCFAAESIAVIAREFPSELSSRVLHALFEDPSAVDRLAISPVFVAGATLLVVGGTMRKICYLTLGKYFTFQLAIFKDHKLITTGPYAIVRHPAYIAFLMADTGLLLVQLFPGSYVWESGMLKTPWKAVLWGGWGFIVFLLQVMTVRRVPREDAVMEAEFGKEWEEWARRTPYKLIPYVY